MQPPQLDIVFGRNDDFQARVVIVVAAAKFDASLRERGLVRVCPRERRLMRSGPEHAARDIADVAEAAPVVARRILSPARDGEIFPAAVAAAGVGDHDVVAAIRQQLHFGARRVGARQNAHRHLRQASARRGCPAIVAWCRYGAADFRDALLQQEERRLKLGQRLEALLHRPAEQQVREREQRHALMVGHERSHDRAAIARVKAARARSPPPRKSRTVRSALVSEALQIRACRFRRRP